MSGSYLLCVYDGSDEDIQAGIEEQVIKGCHRRQPGRQRSPWPAAS